MEGQMHLSGQLSDWSINDLLQIMQVTSKTGSLDIEGERHGRVHFREGVVTGAELVGDTDTGNADDRGGVADVLYVLSAFDEGSFQVGDADGPDGKGWSVEDVMADVEALQKLESDVMNAGLIEAPGVRFVQSIQEPITVEPDDWAVLMNLVQPFTFDHLESRLGRGAAVRVFHTLHRLGVAEGVADDGESEWLDRLADDISAESEEATWLESPAEESESEPDLALLPEPDPVADPEPLPEPEPVVAAVADIDDQENEEVKGLSAPASTTLTDGVYDEIRRLRSKVADK